MKKGNNKGFFLSETMVVIAVVAVVLLGVFKIFSSVYSKYKESETYNTVNATNAVVSLKKYYQSVGFDYATLLGSNYYVELTDEETFDSEYYDNLKISLDLNNVYLIDMVDLFEGTNINAFDISLRKYLKTLQNTDIMVALISITNGNEYGSVTVVSGDPPTLVGDADDEFVTIVPINGTFTDPGYTNWDGDAPTTEWETELDTSTEGTYYLKYNFDGYLLRRRVVVYKQNYTYIEGFQTFIVPYSGYYNIELWGAQGSLSSSKGSYVSGKIYLTKNTNIYLYIGEGLKAISNGTSFNGGTGSSGGHPGGGATDIRLVSGIWSNSTGINSRIMVAAGSGSGSGNNTTVLGAGGTLVGNAGGGTAGGTQLTYGAVQNAAYTVSSFGIANGGCAGGNGYYPGGGATCASGAGGGSSFISGYAGVNAITSSSSTTPTYNTMHYSNNYFIDGYMELGVNAGNGSAKITYMGEGWTPVKTNANLNGVRYIKDCINGSSANTGNHWVELQAIYNGINVAKSKTVTGTVAENASYPYSRIVDGDITSSVYAAASATGLQCVTVDLTQSYNLDEVAVWHYWADARTYNSNVVYVSSDNTNWTTLISTNAVETCNGKRTNAWD